MAVTYKAIMCEEKEQYKLQIKNEKYQIHG